MDDMLLANKKAMPIWEWKSCLIEWATFDKYKILDKDRNANLYQHWWSTSNKSNENSHIGMNILVTFSDSPSISHQARIP